MKKHTFALFLLYFLKITLLQSQFIINEIYADVAVSLIGDANGDGIRNAREDEFIELFNKGDLSLDISGYQIVVGELIKHEFAKNTILPPKSFIVVFGGGIPNGLFGGSSVEVASSGNFGLSNGGATILLQDTSETTIDQVTYTATDVDASLVRTPEFEGEFLPHTERPDAFGLPYSPGTLTNSFPFNNGDTTLIQFTANRGIAIEKDTAIDLFLNLINPKRSQVVATIELTGGTGTAEDLQGFTTRTVNFPVNSNSQRLLRIPITDDNKVEGKETFVFTITSINNPDSNQVSINKSFELTLFDDDTNFGLVLTEFLADPPNNELGDANKDGVRSASEDEFVEFQNMTNQVIDLTGMGIYDANVLRHQFPDNTIIQPNQLLVVFGGGDISADFGEAVVQKASTNRLSLANGGDRIILRDSLNNIAYFHEFGLEGGQNQSIVFCSNLGDTDGPKTLHSTIDDGLLFSPGFPSACTLMTSTNIVEESLSAIKIFPNPTIGRFFVDFPVGLNLESGQIMDVSGRTVFSFHQTGWVNLPITLGRGLHFLKIKTDKGILVRKVILK